MTVKISRVRHVLVTSIIFLIIIAVIVWAYNARIAKLEEDTADIVWRVAAKSEIAPGTTITADMVEKIKVQNVLPKVKTFAYRLYAEEMASELFNGASVLCTDDRYVVGKTATEKIYSGEWINVDRLKSPTEIADASTRLYSIPFDSTTTGGYNVNVEEEVDICVLYDEDSDNIRKYQTLPNNKTIDIVLAKKTIEDIRDESGNSAKDNAAVVPGYICFRLTYDEINKLELAKRQGTLFIGKVGDYYSGERTETFMSSTALPNI